jgi:enoyl-CoA hydratase
MTTAVEVDEAADRVVVHLARPEVRNAIDHQMVTELHGVCGLVERDPRVLLLAGKGGNFAAGADISQLRERRRDDALRGINSALFDRIHRLPMPVAPSSPTRATSASERPDFASATRNLVSGSSQPPAPRGG